MKTTSESTPSYDDNVDQNRPSHLDFDEFLPWACMRMNILTTIINITKTYQSDYFNTNSARAKKKANEKSKLGDKLPHMVPKTSCSSTTLTDTEITCDVLNITTVYNDKDKLVQLKFLYNKRIPVAIMKIIGLIIEYQSHLTNVTINKALCKNTVLEISKWLTTSYITDLCLDDTVIGDANYDLLLNKQSFVQQLSLSRCRIDDKTLRRIALKLSYPLPASKTLSILKLTSNEITDAGAKYMAEALRTNRKLAYLNMADNFISDDGFKAIFDVLDEFIVHEDELLEGKRRYVNYLIERNELVYQLLREYENGDTDGKSSKNTRRKTSKINSVQISSSSRKSKGTSDIVSVTTTDDTSSQVSNEIQLQNKAKNTAETQMGKFEDPFASQNIHDKDGIVYCYGNNTLAYINLACNDLSYISVKKLVHVLLKQKIFNRKPKGLVNISIEGNQLPQDCVEMNKIHEILNETLKLNSIVRNKRRSKNVSSDSVIR